MSKIDIKVSVIRRAVERLAKLTNEIDDLHYQLDEKVQEVARRVEKADKGFCCDQYEQYDWTFNSFIDCNWEETWRYGGHETHNIIFLAKFLFDEESLKTYEEECCQKREEEAKNKLASKEAKDRLQYEELKAKFDKLKAKFDKET